MGGRTTKTNVPADELHWSIERAAAEFGLSPMTLRRALAKISAKPDENGCFTTAQVADALYGQLHLEKIKTQQEVTEKLRIENMVSRAELLNRRELAKGLAAIVDAFTSRLMVDRELSRMTKEDLLKDLSSWPLVLEEASRAQSRLRRNGKQPEEADGES
jgi:hypothetical protein